MKSKKGMVGGIWSLVGVILAFVVMGVIASVGMTVTDDAKTDIVAQNAGAGCNSTHKTSCGAGYNATLNSETSVLRVANKGPTIATAAVFGVIIAILLGIVAYFKVFR